MKKIALFLIPFLLATAVFLGFMFFAGKNFGKGALQVTSTPKSNVYLDEKLIGQTPLCKCEESDMLEVGEHTIRLVPEEGFSPFEEKIVINKGILTVVDRFFGKSADSEGSIITLSPINDRKTSELLIISFPDKADVFLDNSPSGQTPLLLKNVTASDHELKLTKDGYKEKIVRIRTVLGYRLKALVFLGVSQVINISPSPTASPSATPSIAKVVILNTPTGFLRVRADPSISALEIAQVLPGETLELLEETDGWFKVGLADGKVGFISAQYAKRQ